MSNQYNRLSSKNCKEVLMQIYKNRYFTNHGPLTQQFESELETFLSVSNAVTIMNNTLAIMIAMSGSYSGKKVAILSGCEKDVLDAVNISNVDFVNTTIDSLATESLSSIGMLVVSSNTLTKDNSVFLKGLEEKGIIVIICYLSISDFHYHENFENAISVYSLGSGTLVQGGIITTNDGNLAEIFRNMRSSYGVRKTLKVKATCNGRFSEVQAGIGLNILKKCI
jgi:hypothetical protein